MKTKLTSLILSVFSVLFFSHSEAFSQDTTLSVMYTGSAGYILESPNKKVLIDGIFDEIVAGFDAGYPSQAIIDSIDVSGAPFDSIDLFIFSHEHPGHFDPEKALACFIRNPEASMITTAGAKAQIEEIAENWEELEPKIYVPEIGPYETIDTVFQDIDISLLRIPHSTPTGLYNAVLNIEGMIVAYYIGYTPSADEFYGQTQGIDVGLIQGSWITDQQELTRSIYDMKFISLTHLNGFTFTKPNLNDFISENGLSDVNFMSMAMEEMYFSKVNDSIIADTINLGPELVNKLPDTDVYHPGETVTYTVPENTFSDPDGDDIKIDIIRPNQAAVPDWISIDLETLTVSGTPDEAKNVRFNVVATDKYGSYISDDFIIFVEEEPSSLNSKNHDNIIVYPNPVSDYIEISLKELQTKINFVYVYNMAGEQVLSNIIEENHIRLDLETLTPGEYVISIKGPEVDYSEKIICH